MCWFEVSQYRRHCKRQLSPALRGEGGGTHRNIHACTHTETKVHAKVAPTLCSGLPLRTLSTSCRKAREVKNTSQHKKTPITPFGGPFWVSRCRETEGNMKNEGEKPKKQKTTKSQDMKSTHLLGGCIFGAFFTVELGIF